MTLFMGVGASIFNPILNLILNNNFTKLLKGFEHFDEKVSMRLWDENELERVEVTMRTENRLNFSWKIYISSVFF